MIPHAFSEAQAVPRQLGLLDLAVKLKREKEKKNRFSCSGFMRHKIRNFEFLDDILPLESVSIGINYFCCEISGIVRSEEFLYCRPRTMRH